MNDISLVASSSPRSPRSSPLPPPPEQTMDIVLSLPKRYPNRRKTRTFLYSLNSLASGETSSQAYGRDSYSEDTNRNSVSPLVDLQVLAPSSGSETPCSPSHSSLIQLRRPLPHTSNTCVLSVSNDVGRDDLLRPDDRVMHIRLPRRRDRRHGSILRNLVESRLAVVYRKSGESEENDGVSQREASETQQVNEIQKVPEAEEPQQIEMTEKVDERQQTDDPDTIEDRKEESRTVEDLINMVDSASHREPHSIVSFDDIDFSHPSTPIQDTEEEDEDWMSLFNELMREECPVPIDGEEMERGTGEEERLIWDENEESEEEKRREEEEESEEERQEEEKKEEEEEKGEEREAEKPIEEAEQEEPEQEMKVDEPEADPLEETRSEESQHLPETETIPQISTEPRVTEMPIETMLQTMGYELSTLTQQESPQEPVERIVEEIQEEPFPVPIVEMEMKECEPTEEQKERVRKWEAEFQFRMEEKEKEEKERREQIRQQAKVQLEMLNEEWAQLCDLHRHERYEVKPATPRWREIEFGNVLGECAPLLSPLIGIMDLLLGAVL